jgi:hypothetical protein
MRSVGHQYFPHAPQDMRTCPARGLWRRRKRFETFGQRFGASGGPFRVRCVFVPENRSYYVWISPLMWSGLPDSESCLICALLSAASDSVLFPVPGPARDPARRATRRPVPPAPIVIFYSIWIFSYLTEGIVIR